MDSSRLQVVVEAETSKLKRGVADAKGEVQGFASKAKSEMDKVDDAIKNAGTGLVEFGKKAGTALAAVGTALIGSAAATEEYRQGQAKLNAAFEAAGSSADMAKYVYDELYKTLGDSDVAVEAANHLAKLTTNGEDLAEWTEICTGVMATFGDSLPIEGLTESANETAKVGEVTGSLADALIWAGVSEDEFNEKLAACNDEAEREKLIRETLIGLYDEAANNYKEQAGAIMEQREAQAKLQETLAALGEAMTPVLTAFTNFAAEALAPVTEKIAPLADKYGPKLADVMGQAGEAVGDAFGFFVDNWGVIAAIAGVVGGIAAAIGLYNAVAAVKAAMDAAQVTSLGALVAVQWAHVTATLAALAPYVAIVAAIAAVIAIIVLCVKHWDEIKAKVKEVAEAIRQKVSEMRDKVVQFFSDLAAKAKQKVEDLRNAAVSKFEALRSAVTSKVQGAKDAAVNAFENLRSGIANKVQSARDTVTGVFDSIKSGITSKINAARDTVQSAIDRIKSFFNFSWSLPHLKLPHISISGSFSLTPPSVPKFGISWYQYGGVFDSPHLFPFGNGQIGGLGENGAEAIVPLEKNTQWLDKIAERLNGSRRGGDLVLQIDGKTFARVSLDAINDNTKQTGRLGLQLV
jgi:hypothetical protein